MFLGLFLPSGLRLLLSASKRFLNWLPLELVHHQGPKLEAAQRRPAGLRMWGLQEVGLLEATEDYCPKEELSAVDLH